MSLDRATDFLHHTELLDTYATGPSLVEDSACGNAIDAVGFKDTRFGWSSEAEDVGSLTAPTRTFCLRIQGELRFRRGGINLVIGPTGCGKTSLLMALLGEMHFTAETPASWFNLPREGGVAFAAQESWVLNETIKVRR